MHRLIISMIDINIANINYQIRLNNYRVNHADQPIKDSVKNHDQLSNEIRILRGIQQKITSLWEGL